MSEQSDVINAESTENLALTNDDIDQLVQGIEEFIISGAEDLVPIWQPYIDKLNALKVRPVPSARRDG